MADHRVAFTVRGITRFEPSFASLDPVPGQRAWSALVRYAQADWATIRRDELSYRGITAEGGAVAAQAFSVLETHRTIECRPGALSWLKPLLMPLVRRMYGCLRPRLTAGTAASDKPE